MSESNGGEPWLLAGQTLLRDGGIGAVKLQALTDELGLTTGSFYHHFRDMAEYLDELARYYASDETGQRSGLAEEPDPRQRLRQLHAHALDRHLHALDAAMRDWAGSNELAAEAIARADRILLEYIARAFLDLGYRRPEAQLRAQLFASAGVARIRPPWQVPPTVVDDVLAILAPETNGQSVS